MLHRDKKDPQSLADEIFFKVFTSGDDQAYLYLHHNKLIFNVPSPCSVEIQGCLLDLLHSITIMSFAFHFNKIA